MPTVDAPHMLICTDHCAISLPPDEVSRAREVIRRNEEVEQLYSMVGSVDMELQATLVLSDSMAFSHDAMTSRNFIPQSFIA
ncbi:hypothetical protein Aduo_019805 [Ancylostoma duodenale]